MTFDCVRSLSCTFGGCGSSGDDVEVNLDEFFLTFGFNGYGGSCYHLGFHVYAAITFSLLVRALPS